MSEHDKKARAAILRRRAQLVTAAVSTVSLSAATAHAQVCLSPRPPKPPPCARDEQRLGGGAAPLHLLEVARCFADRERNLEQALRLYERFLRESEGDPTLLNERRRAAWAVRRIRIVQGAGDPDRPPRPLPPEPDEPPGEIEVVVAPDAAPRTGGAAGCGCELGRGPEERGRGAGLWMLAAALARLWRRR